MTIQVIFDRRKQGKNGAFELYIYVSSRDFVYLSTKVRIGRSYYDKKTNRVSYKHPTANALNYQINQLVRSIEDAHLTMLRNNKTVTVAALLEAVTNPHTLTLNDYMKQQIEIDIPLLSHGRIKHVRSAIKDFDQFGTYALDDFTADVLRKYHNHLITHMQITSTSKNHGVIKKYVSRAHADGLMKKNPYAAFKIPAANIKRIYLEEDELNRLRAYAGHPRLEKVRDIFLFMINTGMGYSDMASLTPDHIVEANKTMYLIKKRQKTDVTQTVPLFDEALQLIAKHSDGKKLFPSISGQKLNQYLKELATLCQITKEITSHTARHTFATLLITRGVPMESVSVMLGHSNLKTTAIYGQIISRKLSKDLERLDIKGL